MTVNTINIVGQVLPPTGVPDARSRVFFVMTGYDTDADDDAVIYPVPGKDDEDGFPIAADGKIDVDLWPNQEGERNTLYRVEVQVHQLNRPVRVPIASISVPNTGGPYNLNDLLGVEPPPDATVDEYIAELAAAAAAAEAAAYRARAWAENPEDVEVDPTGYPGEYSARHHAAKAAEKAGEIQNLTASATGLAAGDPPTADYNPATGELAFGIPAGADWPDAPNDGKVYGRKDLSYVEAVGLIGDYTLGGVFTFNSTPVFASAAAVISGAATGDANLIFRTGDTARLYLGWDYSSEALILKDPEDGFAGRLFISQDGAGSGINTLTPGATWDVHSLGDQDVIRAVHPDNWAYIIAQGGGGSDTTVRLANLGTTGSGGGLEALGAGPLRFWNNSMEMLRLDPASNKFFYNQNSTFAGFMVTSTGEVRVRSKRDDTTFNNASLRFDSPRSNTADGDAHDGRAMITSLGNSVGNSPIFWIATQSASLSAQNDDATLKNTNGYSLRLSDTLQLWSGNINRFEVNETGAFVYGDKVWHDGNVLEDITAYTPPWEYNPNVENTPRRLGFQDTVAASDADYRVSQMISVEWDGDAAVPSGDPTVPLGLYVQHRQTGSDAANNAYTHSIMAYALNDAAGNNDVVALSGRARREQVTDGVGDAAGVWGTGRNWSTNDGGVMGGEFGIQQNVAGSTPTDSGGSESGQPWTMGIHVYSYSLGSAANAGIDIDSPGLSADLYGFWNGIIIQGDAFGHDGNGNAIAGTVGINMGSWTGTARAETAIKFGDAKYHLRRDDDDLRVRAGRFVVEGPDAAPAGVLINSLDSSDAYIDFNWSGALRANIILDDPSGDFRLRTFNSAHDIVLSPNGTDLVRLDTSGQIIADLPTGAGSPPGSVPSKGLWVDTNAGRVVKQKA